MATADALELLIPLADQYPEQILTELNSLALDQLNCDLFSRQPLRALLAAIPISQFEMWQTAASPDELAALAYHLPVPQIAESGESEIPSVTRMLLEDPRAGDRALEQFCHGSVTWNLEDKNDEFGHMMSSDVYGALEWISGAEALRLAPSRQIQKWYEFLLNYLAPVKHLHERLNEDAKEAGYHLS